MPPMKPSSKEISEACPNPVSLLHPHIHPCWEILSVNENLALKAQRAPWRVAVSPVLFLMGGILKIENLCALRDKKVKGAQRLCTLETWVHAKRWCVGLSCASVNCQMLQELQGDSRTNLLWRKNKHVNSNQGNQAYKVLLTGPKTVLQINSALRLNLEIDYNNNSAIANSKCFSNCAFRSTEHHKYPQTAAVDKMNENKYFSSIWTCHSQLLLSYKEWVGSRITGSQRIVACYCGHAFPPRSLTAIHLSDLKTQCCDWMVVIKMFSWFQPCSAVGLWGK